MARLPQPCALRHSLSFVLGSEAKLRLLREAFTGGWRTAADLARASNLSIAKASIALDELTASAVLEAEGEGPTRSLRAAPEHPARAALVALFAAEAAMAEDLDAAIVEAVGPFGGEVRGGWLHGEAGRQEAKPGGLLQVAVLARGRRAPAIRDAIEAAVRRPARALGLTPEVTVFIEGNADLAALQASAEEARPLFGERATDLLAEARGWQGRPGR